MTPDVTELLERLSHERGGGVSTIALNLVGFVDDGELLQWLQERTDVLARHHSCRSILLDACHKGEPEVSTLAQHREETVTVEQLVLKVRDLNAEQLRSVVHDLLVPNVQTVVMWTGKHLAADERFRPLVQLSSSAVVDSSRLERTIAGLEELLRFVADGSASPLQDLAYMRLRPWQDVIAQFFDSPELTSQLGEIERVEIACGSAAEGYYLIGWLASRLGWKPCGVHEFCNVEGRTVRISFSRAGQPRRIRSVVLATPQTRFIAEIREDAAGVLCTRVSGAYERTERCVPLAAIDMLSLVERAIMLPRADQVFLESLDMTRTILAEETS